MGRTHLAAQLGPVVKQARRTIGWSQRQLAARVGISQAWICRVERGTADGLTLDTLDRVLEELGILVKVAPENVNLQERRLQREPAHALAVAYVARRLESADWNVRTEVEIGSGRYRGWIDVLAWHPDSRTVLVVELKTEVRDLGAVQRQMGWYEREAWTAATGTWGRPAALRSALVLLATGANDRTTFDMRLVIRAWAPLGAGDLAHFIEDPRGHAGGRFVALVDPLSRRRDWLVRTRSQGRRSEIPDADYAAFMARRRRRSG